MRAVLKEILLDVGQVKSRDPYIVIDEVLSDSADGFRSREIADKRDNQISQLHVPHRPVIAFRGQIAPIASRSVGGGHQLFVRRRTAAAPEAADVVVEIGPGFDEDTINVTDRIEVFFGKSKLMVSENLFDGGKILLSQRRIALKPFVTGKQDVRIYICVQTARTFPRVQPRKEIRAIAGELEKGFIHQVLDHVLPPDIDDESDFRLECGNVSKILLGTDSQVNTSGLRDLLQPRNYPLKTHLVGKKIFEPEVSPFLGKTGHDLPKSIVGKSTWKRFRRFVRNNESRQRDEKYNRRHDAKNGSLGDHDETVLFIEMQ